MFVSGAAIFFLKRNVFIGWNFAMATMRADRGLTHTRDFIFQKLQKKYIGHKNVINARTEIYKHFLESS